MASEEKYLAMETGQQSVERLMTPIWENSNKADKLASITCFLMMAIPFVATAMTLVGITLSEPFRKAGFGIVWQPVIVTIPFLVMGIVLIVMNRMFIKRRNRHLHELREQLIAEDLHSIR
tara:strand:- start:37 stop:396 length:360 start_codon:yes stop_codon:yes gene_type:complete